MAKQSKKNVGLKRTFGKRRTGKFKKSYGPKSEKPKPYKGQGR